MPTVSILLAFYNGRAYLRDAVASVRAQTYEHWELIVVNDGSLPSEARWLSDYLAALDDARIRLHHQPNRGLAETRNVALRLAVGRWIAWLDQDDLWDPDKLAQQLAVDPVYGLVLCDGRVIAPGQPPRPYGIGRHLAAGYVPDLYARLLRRNLVIASGALVRADVARLAGPSRRDYVVAPDYDVFLRVAQLTPAVFLAAPLVSYRAHADSTTAQKRLRLALEVIDILARAPCETWRDTWAVVVHSVKAAAEAVWWRLHRRAAV